MKIDSGVNDLVRLEHTRRLAVIWLRTSSAAAPHPGGRDLAIRLERRGWPPSRITVIDASGSPSDGPAFERLFDLVERGTAGIVAARDLSRISRSPSELLRFLAAAVRHDVLLDIDGRLRAPAEVADEVRRSGGAIGDGSHPA